MSNTWELEVGAKRRFEFGRNWQRFLQNVTEAQIVAAEQSLQRMLGVDSLTGRSFLDVGSGSGIFSLAAVRLGARRVHSFDYDPESVACARQLKRRYFPDEQDWVIERGSALDPDYLNGLKSWDIVYSWGVLHHTGDMWRALDNVAPLVAPAGSLFISLYNDQGSLSKFWQRIKLFYNRGRLARALVLAGYVPVYVCGTFAMDLVHLKNPFHRYTRLGRGMSIVYDWLDWLGGYPFEVAGPDAVVSFYRTRGFELTQQTTVGRKSGCNEFVFRKLPSEG